MDCKTARILIEFDRPGALEFGPGETAELRAHLAECPECAELAQAERAADQALGRAVRAVPVPDLLRERLVARLNTDRRLVIRRRRVRQAAGLAVAACLVVGVWLGLRWHNRPIVIDPYQVTDAMLAEIINPSPQRVEEAFKDLGIDAPAPRDFNFRFLKYYGVAELQGKRVPFLLFVQGQEQARVYILSDRKFDIAAALAIPPGTGSGCKMDVRPSADGGVAYLVVYTGDSLEPFLIGKEPTAA